MAKTFSNNFLALLGCPPLVAFHIALLGLLRPFFHGKIFMGGAKHRALHRCEFGRGGLPPPLEHAFDQLLRIHVF